MRDSTYLNIDKTIFLNDELIFISGDYVFTTRKLIIEIEISEYPDLFSDTISDYRSTKERYRICSLRNYHALIDITDNTVISTLKKINLDTIIEDLVEHLL